MYVCPCWLEIKAASVSIKMQTESELISASPVAAVCLVAQSAQSLSAEVISQQFGGEAEDRNSLLLNTDCSFFFLIITLTLIKFLLSTGFSFIVLLETDHSGIKTSIFTTRACWFRSQFEGRGYKFPNTDHSQSDWRELSSLDHEHYITLLAVTLAALWVRAVHQHKTVHHISTDTNKADQTSSVPLQWSLWKAHDC